MSWPRRENPTGFRSRHWPLIAAAIVALLAAACSTSNDRKVEVTATDYRFTGLPATVKAGAVLTLINASTKEVHELVAMRLPDTERRPVGELARLPMDQLEALFSGPPAAALVAPPDRGPQIAGVGDGSLKERGRYLVLCFVPTGADPSTFLNAAKAAQGSGGPPQPVAGGPPHFAEGMYAQVVVE